MGDKKYFVLMKGGKDTSQVFASRQPRGAADFAAVSLYNKEVRCARRLDDCNVRHRNRMREFICEFLFVVRAS